MRDQLSPKTDTYLDALRELPRAFYKTPLVGNIEKFVEPYRVDRAEDVAKAQQRNPPEATQT